MQHFIMFPPKQIQLQSIGKQVGFTEALGGRMKTKFTAFHIKIPIRQCSTAKAFLFHRLAPHHPSTLPPHLSSHLVLVACANSGNVAPDTPAILLPRCGYLILP